MAEVRVQSIVTAPLHVHLLQRKRGRRGGGGEGERGKGGRGGEGETDMGEKHQP